MNLRIVAALLFSVLVATPAFAQVRQSGGVTTGHVAQWATNGVIQDGGSALNGSINALGITATGTPFCINDSVASGQYHQLCFGSNSLGGGLISFNAYGGASNLPLQLNINGVTTPIGTGTINNGTAGQLGYYATTGSTISGDVNATITNGAFTLGQSGSVLGKLLLSGSASGTLSIVPQAASGTYEFDLPTTAGTAGQVLTSQGGAGTAMTWTSIGGSVIGATAGQFGYYATTGNAISGSSILTLSGSTLSVTSGFTASPANLNDVFSPTGTGTVTIAPGTLGTIDNMTIGGVTPAAGTFTTLNASTTITAGVAASTSGTVNISGGTGGTVSIKTQASAGTYNFNLPITAGTSGHPLLSGGGGASPMTYGSLSGNTSTFATTTGALTSGHAATFDASGNIQDGGTLPTGSINSGTANQLTYYAGTGTTVSGNANLTVSAGALTVGITGAQAGSVLLSGSSTGAVSILGSGTAIGTYNFNLPITAGSSGGPLLSGGGGASAMTWGTASGNTSKFGTVTGSLTNGHCIAADASGNLIDNGSTCGTGGSGTVTSSSAGQIAYYPSSTNAVAGNSSLTISGSALTIGVAASTTGSLALTGLTGGTITIKPQSSAGTYEFDLPTTAGSAGQVLTSQGGAGTPMTWSAPGFQNGGVKTTAFNASANTTYCVDTKTTGAVTATLPGSPTDFDQIRFIDCKHNFNAAALTVARNGNSLMGVTQDMTVNTLNASFTLQWSSTVSDWVMY